jgi:pyruvate ferredoxin oxidoreductase beta subunit
LEWLKPQGRFRHLFKEENAGILEEIQKHVDKDWDELNKLASS